MAVMTRGAGTGALPRPGEVRIRTVPPRPVLAIDGQGAPGSPSFQAAVGALYSVAYGVHFTLKRRGTDAPVGTLEGLWSTVEPRAAADPEAFMPGDPADWRWTLLFELPEAATDDDVAAARRDAERRHPSPALADLAVRRFDEGLVVEALHVGPYATEPETIARMVAAATEAGLARTGPHHEIYLGDPRRSAPERLRTVLRLPLLPSPA